MHYRLTYIPEIQSLKDTNGTKIVHCNDAINRYRFRPCYTFGNHFARTGSDGGDHYRSMFLMPPYRGCRQATDHPTPSLLGETILCMVVCYPVAGANSVGVM